MGANLDEATWVEVRYEFESGTLPVRRVASMYGITHAAIYDRAGREGWRLRSERGRRGSGLRRGRGMTRPAETHEERHQRFYRIIDRLLEKMESNVINSPDLSPQDQERSAKALSSTLMTVERVTELAGEMLKGGAKAEGDTSDGDAEAQRMRREIAERLERLSARWLEGAKPE